MRQRPPVITISDSSQPPSKRRRISFSTNCTAKGTLSCTSRKKTFRQNISKPGFPYLRLVCDFGNAVSLTSFTEGIQNTGGERSLAEEEECILTCERRYLHDDPLQGSLQGCPENWGCLAPHAFQALDHQCTLPIHNLLFCLKGPPSVSALVMPCHATKASLRSVLMRAKR